MTYEIYINVMPQYLEVILLFVCIYVVPEKFWHWTKFYIEKTLDIIRYHYEHGYRKEIRIGDHVNVGACVGKIEQINDDTVVVKGTYYYCDEEDNEEPWENIYSISKFKERLWSKKFKFWDFDTVDKSSYKFKIVRHALYEE